MEVARSSGRSSRRRPNGRRRNSGLLQARHSRALTGDWSFCFCSGVHRSRTLFAAVQMVRTLTPMFSDL